MGKQSFSAMMFLVAVFAATINGQCADPSYQPDKIVIMGVDRTICDEAASAGIDCAVFAKCLEIFQYIKEDTTNPHPFLSIRIPVDTEIVAAEKVLGYRQPSKDTVCHLQAKAKAKKKPAKSVGKTVGHPAVCASSETYVHVNRMPFNEEDYTRCRYLVSETDQTNKKTLRQLARDFHSPAIRLSFFNSMPSDALLLARQQIAIPDWDFTYWRFINRDPVGKRTLDELKAKVWPKLRIFRQHPELIEVMADLYSRQQWKPSSIHSGERFTQWMSDTSCIVLDNGVCAIPADSFATARRFDLDLSGEDSTAIVKVVDACYNWTVLKVPREPELPVVPPVKIVERPLIPVPVPEIPKKVDSLPPAVKPPPTAVPEPARIKNEQRFYLWANDDRPEVNKHLAFDVQGAQACGFNLDLLWGSSKSYNRYGLTLMGDYYDGEAVSGFHYYGFEGSVGPLAFISFSPSLYWGVDVGVGGQWNWNTGSANYQYDAFSTNMYLRHGQTFDAMPPTMHLSFWASAKWAFAAEKQSTRQGIHTVQSGTTNPDSLDPVYDNSGADGGMRWYFLCGISPVEPLIVYRTAYAIADNARTNALGIGFALFDESLIFEFYYKNRSASIWDNGNAAGALVNWVIHSKGSVSPAFK